MSSLLTLIQITTTIVLMVIVVSFVLPGLSSFIRQKLKGKTEEEIFDLDNLVRRKEQAIRIAPQQESLSTPHGRIQEEGDDRSRDLLKEYYWGQGPNFAALIAAVREFPITIDELTLTESLRTSLKVLLEETSFNGSVNSKDLFPRLVLMGLAKLGHIEHHTLNKVLLLDDKEIHSLYNGQGKKLLCPLLLLEDKSQDSDK